MTEFGFPTSGSTTAEHDKLKVVMMCCF